jgi:Na+/H+ antiporter NhaD/arsenite permease-like protein
MSISLDAAGLLRFMAFWAAKKGGSSGQRLYFYFYLFFLVCGVVVGNVRILFVPS